MPSCILHNEPKKGGRLELQGRTIAFKTVNLPEVSRERKKKKNKNKKKKNSLTSGIPKKG